METKGYYENMIAQCSKRIDFYAQEINVKRSEIAQLNTNIDYAQSDIDYANEQLNNGNYAE